VSPLETYLRRLARLGPRAARLALSAALDERSNTELAAMRYDWRGVFARPTQLPPATPWRSFGFLGARGLGKTRALAEFVNDEVETGRARLVGLAAQDERKAIDIQVTGPSGLIATSPPWFRPRFEASALQVVWPNGARGYIRTPESPGNIRGVDYHLSWLSELQSWPSATREEAFSNFLLTTRLGYARTVFDATPKQRHPILRQLLARAEADPSQHVIVKGTMHENALNLGRGVIEEIERQIGGTRRGREEILGEMIEESEAALIKQVWIEEARRNALGSYVRRVIGIDPAVTARHGSDRTGIIEAGSGVDGQIYVIGDHSGKYEPPVWGALVVDTYLQHGVDYVVAETNKGGDLVTTNLRAVAQSRGLSVVTVGKDERPQRRAGVLFVKEAFARGAKEDRAQPVATAYERRRISHVIGANLGELEDDLTTWEPQSGQRSPDAIDALVHACVDLLDLAGTAGPDPRAGFVGIGKLQEALSHGASAPAIGLSPVTVPARGATTNVAGHRVQYDGSRGLRDLFSGGSSNDRIGGR
jgi:phage terminase large subunit-like protein